MADAAFFLPRKPLAAQASAASAIPKANLITTTGCFFTCLVYRPFLCGMYSVLIAADMEARTGAAGALHYAEGDTRMIGNNKEHWCSRRDLNPGCGVESPDPAQFLQRVAPDPLQEGHTPFTIFSTFTVFCPLHFWHVFAPVPLHSEQSFSKSFSSGIPISLIVCQNLLRT